MSDGVFEHLVPHLRQEIDSLTTREIKYSYCPSQASASIDTFKDSGSPSTHHDASTDGMNASTGGSHAFILLEPIEKQKHIGGLEVHVSVQGQNVGVVSASVHRVGDFLQVWETQDKQKWETLAMDGPDALQ